MPTTLSDRVKAKLFASYLDLNSKNEKYFIITCFPVQCGNSELTWNSNMKQKRETERQKFERQTERDKEREE